MDKRINDNWTLPVNANFLRIKKDMFLIEIPVRGKEADKWLERIKSSIGKYDGSVGNVIRAGNKLLVEVNIDEKRFLEYWESRKSLSNVSLSD